MALATPCRAVAATPTLAAAPLVLMSLHVEGQVVGAGETSAADGALEGLGPRVLPEVARQLVRAGKAPVAALPRTLVRLLS